MLKSNIAWMKKNVPSDLKVWKGMIQDIDWSQVAAKTKLSLQRDKERITAEFKEFAAMDTSAKIDWLMNGDRHLGYLYLLCRKVQILCKVTHFIFYDHSLISSSFLIAPQSDRRSKQSFARLRSVTA